MLIVTLSESSNSRMRFPGLPVWPRAESSIGYSAFTIEKLEVEAASVGDSESLDQFQKTFARQEEAVGGELLQPPRLDLGRGAHGIHALRSQDDIVPDAQFSETLDVAIGVHEELRAFAAAPSEGEQA